MKVRKGIIIFYILVLILMILAISNQSNNVSKNGCNSIKIKE